MFLLNLYFFVIYVFTVKLSQKCCKDNDPYWYSCWYTSKILPQKDQSTININLKQKTFEISVIQLLLKFHIKISKLWIFNTNLNCSHRGRRTWSSCFGKKKSWAEILSCFNISEQNNEIASWMVITDKQFLWWNNKILSRYQLCYGNMTFCE